MVIKLQRYCWLLSLWLIISLAPAFAFEESLVLVDFGGASESNQFELEGWDQVHSRGYAYLDQGPSGVVQNAGGTLGRYNRYNFVGVHSDQPKQFVAGERIKVTWYNADTRNVVVRKIRLSLKDLDYATGGKSREPWYSSPTLLLEPGQTGHSYFDITQDNQGLHDRVSVYSKTWGKVLIDKIELVPASVNHPPVFVEQDDIESPAHTPIQFTLEARDDDQDPLTFSEIELPGGSSFDKETRLFYWVPTSDHVRDQPHDAIFEVSDGINTQEMTVEITVTEPLTEEDWLSKILVDFGATPDQNIFGLHGWHTVTSRAFYSSELGNGGLTQGPADARGYNRYNFAGVMGTTRFFEKGEKIKVTWYNDQDQELEVAPLLTFKDLDYKTGGYSKENWYPMTSAVIAPGEFGETYLLVGQDIEDHYDLVKVFVRAGALAVLDKIELLSAQANDPPLVQPIDDIELDEGQTMPPLKIDVTDLDQDTLFFSAEGLPEGAHFDQATGILTWTPTYHQSRNTPYTITFFVTDQIHTVQTSVDIAVADVNRPPQFTSIPGMIMKSEGESISFTLAATDPDSDDLEFSLMNKPEGVDFDEQTGEFSWDLDHSTQGHHNLMFSVTDSKGSSTSHMTEIHVHNVNTPDDTHYVTHMDHIPNFAHPDIAAGPIVTSVADGVWSDQSVWSTGQLPSSQDVVVINHDIELDRSTDVHTIFVGITGHLHFATDEDLTIQVVTIQVWENGRLDIGTKENPIDEDNKIEIMFKDMPFNYDVDPEQFGNGLLTLGTLNIHGAPKSKTWVRLATEVFAGDDTLHLEQPVTGWNSGDKLILPDSRQRPSHLNTKRKWIILPNGEMAKVFSHFYVVENGQQVIWDYQWEEVEIESVEGNTVHLKDPVLYDHPGARSNDGELMFTPHVALLDRNVILRSENPEGIRGHTIAFKRADVDVRYGLFKDLGRTKNEPIDNTQFEEDGTVSHIGTNQIARYPIHTHHLMGPVNENNEGYQFKYIGNAVWGSLKWAYTIHGSSYGLIKDNVAYDGQGAGFVTEDGSEVHNDFIENIAIKMRGTGRDGKVNSVQSRTGNYGMGGSGFWARRTGNNWIGNVAANNNWAGFVITYYYGSRSNRIPDFRGAMIHDQSQTTRLGDIRSLFIGEFADNEVYSMTEQGLWSAWHSTFGASHMFSSNNLWHIKDFKLWHHHDHGIVMYHLGDVLIEGASIIGDQDQFHTGGNQLPKGLTLSTYEVVNFELKDSQIENQYWGIVPPHRIVWGNGGGFEQASRESEGAIFKNNELHNYINILLYRLGGNSQGQPYRKATFTDNEYELIDTGSQIGGFTGSNFYADYGIGRDRYIVGTSEVYVENFLGDPNMDIRIYQYESDADYIVPKTVTGDRKYRFIGAPVEGLTNQELWDQYGLAIGGAVACSSDQRLDLPSIRGIACPLS